MYTEIRELVNFFARFFHLRIPRLKIGMFCEHLANNALLRFQPYWNLNQPKQYEELRIIRVSRHYTDELFSGAAVAVGLQLDEMLTCLPENLIVYVNPGEVFYCHSDYSPPVPVWVGSVSEDLKYNETAFPYAFPPQPIPSSILPAHQQNTNNNAIQPLIPRAVAGAVGAVGPNGTSHDFSVLDWRIPLALVHPRELGYSTNPISDFLMFRYVVMGTPNYTVETFSVTRFGSYRKRPDHEFSVRLQRSLLNAQTNEPSTVQSSSNHNSNTTISSATSSGSMEPHPLLALAYRFSQQNLI